ncbi:MAG: hypothetical protein KF789_09410 [Bdellovibrionaceae bacterium]|nr:hypothetical protein [Pseudobdellovibrionaceae bacterium]
MKHLLILTLTALVFWGQDTFANPLPPSMPLTRLACVTMPFTTSHVLTESPEFFELNVIHHNGTDNMPIFDGVVTPRSLPQIQERGDLYTKMGNDFRIRFEKSQCKVEGGEWVCAKKGKVLLGQLEVESVWFTVEKRRVVTRYADYTEQVARFLFTKAQRTHQISLGYSASDCIFK